MLFTLAGCGGGGGSGSGGIPPSSTTTISGIATKGPITGARVSVYQVASDGGYGIQLGKTVTSGSKGEYSIEIPLQNGPIIVEIVGQDGASYLSEASGKTVPFGATEVFRAIVTNASINQNITVSPFTEAGYQKVIQLHKIAPTTAIDTIIDQGNKYVADIHKIASILANPVADTNYVASLTIIDKIIQTNPTYNTKTVTDMLTNAVTATTTVARTPYTTAVAAAGKQLSATPGVTAVTDSVQVFQNSSIIPIVPTPGVPPVTPPVAPPTAPTNVTASATTSSVTIGWTASTTTSNGGLSYYIYRNGTFVTNTSNLTYTDSGLLASKTYSYVVKAIDGLGNLSLASIAVEITTQAGPAPPTPVPVDTTPPTAPSNLLVSALTSNSVSLVWTASTGSVAITGYDVYRNGTKVATVTSTSYTDASLVIGVSYSFQIKAVNANAISSAFSTTLTVTPSSNPPLITPVTIITGGNVF